MKKILLYTIAYSQQTLEQVESGYHVLDHSSNERSDWREYWPIRNFLQSNDLDDEAYYGFFSPRFREKTGLYFNDVKEFIESAPANVEVLTFSPQVDVGAFFLNVFTGGEACDPGFLATCQQFVDRLGIDIRLELLILDSKATVFSNFIVARPSFWREWLAICEKLYAVAEYGDNDDPLRQDLLIKTSYPGQVERKVFVMERMASLVLMNRNGDEIQAYNPFLLAWSAQLGAFKREAASCDALKVAMKVHGYGAYRDAFDELSQSVLRKALSEKRSSLPEKARDGVPVGFDEMILRRSIPVVINSFNQFAYTKNITEKFLSEGFRNIYILDQASTYPPLLAWLSEVRSQGSAMPMYLPENKGPYHFFLSGLYSMFGGGPFIYTDPDISWDRMAGDFVSRLCNLAHKYKLFKVGPALKLPEKNEESDVCFVSKEGILYSVVEWERQFWNCEIEEHVYNAPIDTTFHLFFPQYYESGRPLIAGLRVAGDGYSVLHLPWFNSDFVPVEEREFYKNRTSFSSWQ